MPITERGRLASTVLDERGRVVSGTLTEQGQAVFGVTGGTNASVTAPVTTATSSALAPSISGDASITSVAANATISSVSPSISTGSNISSTSAAAAAIANAPSVGSVVQIIAVVASATAGAIAPSVTTQQENIKRSTLKRPYIFLDATRLNNVQVEVNLKTLYDYLNSFDSGINFTVTAGGTSITIGGLTQSDTLYFVTVIPSWNTTYWITGKTKTNFTINFGTAPTVESLMDWQLTR